MERYEEKNGNVQLKALERHVPIELVAEIALPDYRSEIRRLLWVRPTVMPPERFIGGGKADFCGMLRICMLYVGPDGALYSAEAEEGYSFSVPMDAFADFDTAKGVELYAEPVVDMLSSRVTGPRRLSVRCRMHATVHGYGEKNLCLPLEGAGDALCRLCEVKESARVFTGGRESLSLSDQLELQGEVRVIDAHGAAMLFEAAAGRDEVHCKGELLLHLLLCREGEGEIPYTVQRRLPFEQDVVMEGATPDCNARATVSVGEISTTVEEGQLICEVQAILCCEVCREEAVLLCRDAFLPGYRAECMFTDEVLHAGKYCGIRNLSIGVERPISELKIPEQAELLDATAEVEIREKAADGMRIVLVGELCTHVLYKAEGEFAVCDVSFPVRVVCEQGNEGMQADVRVACCRMSRVGNALRADAELQLSLLATDEVPVRVLSEAKFLPVAGDMQPKDPEIYYPGEGETLWDVAKRYTVSPDELAACNGIEGSAPARADSLSGKHFLLIP